LIIDEQLPHGWVTTFLGEIAEWGSGGTPSRRVKEYFEGDIPWIKTGELNQKYISDSEEKISRQAVEKSSAKIFPKGSVGIAMYGATIGKLAIWRIDASTNQACAVAKIDTSILFNEFLYYFLLSEKSSLIKAGKGGAQPNISQGVIKSWSINLPPFNEQHRIVAKIEELFSEIDKGVESLKTAKAQLQVYRQALLKHAFEGKLTAQWRSNNPDKVVPAAELLRSIEQAREERYQQQLIDWQTAVEKWEFNGKEGKKPSQSSKSGCITNINDKQLEDYEKLPHEWVYLRAEDISDFITKGTTPSKDKLFAGCGDIPFIKVYNLTKNGRLDFSVDPTFTDRETHNCFLARSKVYPDDVLMNIVGPPLGKVSIVPKTHEEWNINQAIVRFRSCFLDSRYLSNYLLAEQTVRKMSGKAKATAGQFNLTLEICRDVFIPVCGQQEQEEILKLIDANLTHAEAIENEINLAVKKGEILRQSILKKAFSGQLVPQDPTEEPASELLKRIQSEKAERETATKTTKKTKK
jgi:type I restriction enzyme, S subunit